MATFARIVHLDFKGLPLTPHSLCARLQTLRDAGATALLLEWEDMLPFSDELADCASPHAYSAAEVAQVVQRAESLGLEVIPLVQTLGHLEFALKQERRADLREDPHDFGTLCPASETAAALVESLLTQVLALHPNATRVHIGCDEPQLGTLACFSPAEVRAPMSVSLNAQQYTPTPMAFFAAPSTLALSPTSGPLLGGTNITVTAAALPLAFAEATQCAMGFVLTQTQTKSYRES